MIRKSGKSYEIAEWLNSVDKSDVTMEEVRNHIVSEELNAVSHYFDELQHNVGPMNDNEMRYYITALKLYADAIFESAENIIGKKMTVFYNMAKENMTIAAAGIRIDGNAARKEAEHE